jgi:hypothetical protein
MSIAALERRREQVLEAMRSIRTMRPGAVSEQYLKVKHKGEKDAVPRGPYYLWQYYENGKPVRLRLTSAHEVARARQEVAQYKRFGELCKEFEELTRRLGELECEQAASEEAKKKGLTLRRNATRK